MSELQKSLSLFKQKIRNSSTLPSQKRVVAGNGIGSGSGSGSTVSPTKSRVSILKQHQNSLKRQHEDELELEKSQKSTLQISGSHLSTQLHLAVEYIKAQDKPVSVKELEGYFSPGVVRNLLPLLSTINRVRYDPNRRTLEYVSFHDIKSALDLLEYLRSQPTFKGTSVKDLKDGWNGCLELINELEKQNKIIVLRTKKENTPRFVWPNLGGDVNSIEDEFVTMWAKIKLPEGDDLQAKLSENGLKPTSLDPSRVQKVTLSAEPKKKKPRRGKITNQHLKGILKDYSVM